jgi:hypothetical protein
MQSPALPLPHDETNMPELRRHDLREVNPVRGPHTTVLATAVIVSLDTGPALRRKALMFRGKIRPGGAFRRPHRGPRWS